MRTLLLPDIHQDLDSAQRIIDAVQHDRVVCLGDYWDDYDDTPEQARRMARWLWDRMRRYPEDGFLGGNHDIPYLWDGLAKCPGYTPEKHRAIREEVDVSLMRRRIKLHTWVDGWLLSHAGFSAKLFGDMIRPFSFAREALAEQETVCLDYMAAGVMHSWIQRGQDRGGMHLCGGVTWCDYDNFRPVRNLRQVFGHTRRALPRSRGDNHCIDTGLQHYAVIEDGDLAIHEA